MTSEIKDQCLTTSTSRTMILHDNLSTHKTGVVTKYLKENKVTSLLHPVYSSDLAACDFWLFPRLKEILAVHKYTSIQDLFKAINSELRGIPKEEYSADIQQWLRRLQLCIDREGEYFEGL